MKTIKSNFAIFYPSDKVIYLYNENPGNLEGIALSNVVITFKDNFIEIVGNEHEWGFTVDKAKIKEKSLFKAILTCYTIVQ